MPLSHEKEELLARVEAALRLSSWQTLWLVYDHPAKARLLRGGDAIDVWIHIWNLTPGGRPVTRPLERRIQPTGIGAEFTRSVGAKTLILGWSGETGVFAAFDFAYHSGPFGLSPSVQTDLPALQAAAKDGLGVFEKGTGELSIAVRPDMLGLYVEQMDALHGSGTSAVAVDVLRQMAADPLQVDINQIPQARRKVMVTTLQLLRDRRFGERVLGAYGHRCAFCEVQLRLLDAAHILPVKHPDSNDLVTNGIALCALHHRAYDAALVTFDEGYAIHISKALMKDLTASGRTGGLSGFRSALQPTLRLPKAVANRPSTEMVRKANRLRGWP
jgi:putative restriction endonuclease